MWRTLGVGLGMTAAFAAGWMLRPTPGASLPPTHADVAGPAAATRAAPGRCPPCDDRALEACQRELEAAQAFAALEQAQREGTPRPFPDDLPEAFRPDAFEANVAQAVEECGVAPAALIDCDEYPCFAVFPGADARRTLKSCDWWTARYPQATVSASSGDIFTEDGQRRYEMLGELAPGVSSPLGADNAQKRFEVRTEALRLELMAQWDGFEPTPEEQHAAMLDFWERLADEGNEAAVQMVEQLRAQAP